MRKIANLYGHLDPAFICLYPKYMKFCFEYVRNFREDNNGHRQTTFGFDNETKCSYRFC